MCILSSASPQPQACNSQSWGHKKAPGQLCSPASSFRPPCLRLGSWALSTPQLYGLGSCVM